MPGSIWALSCPECDAHFEIRTGAGFLPRPGNPGRGSFSFEQMICARCQSLFSVMVENHGEGQPSQCPACEGALERWAGFAGFRDGRHSEVVEGPCARCQSPLQTERVALWD
jgi:hypothetical protein